MVREESEQVIENETNADVELPKQISMTRSQRKGYQMALDAAAQADAGDGRTVCMALCAIAKEVGVQKVTELAKLERTSFYRTFNGQTDARLSNVMRVVRALGLQLKLR